jgi:Site-specific recombinase XerD
VFTREDGSALRPEYATRHFQALAQDAGLPVIRLHDLRHVHATHLLLAGVPVHVVAERLGHSQIAITADLYTHVNSGPGRAAADQIARALRRRIPAVPAASLQRGPKTSPQEGGDTDGHT